MSMKKFEMYAQLYESKRRFSRACDQILLLNARLHGLQKRYQSARSSNSKTFRFPLRMRIMVAQGLVKSYYHYAELKRSEIIDLRSKLDQEDISSDEPATDDEEPATDYEEPATDDEEPGTSH